MYYTEEELLEAVDILVEEYGFYEDEAIDMICEAYEMELLDEGLKNLPTSTKYFKDDLIALSKVNGKKYVDKSHADGYTDEDIEMVRKTLRSGAAKSGKQFATDAAPLAVAAGTATAGTIAYKAYKKNKAKKEAEARRRRTLRGRLSRRRR